jgi:hypothetical protein
MAGWMFPFPGPMFPKLFPFPAFVSGGEGRACGNVSNVSIFSKEYSYTDRAVVLVFLIKLFQKYGNNGNIFISHSI